MKLPSPCIGLACPLVLVVAAVLSAPAGEPPERSYAASEFHPIALTGTDAVVREYWTSFEEFDAGSARLKVVRAITVLGPNGRNRGEISLTYDRFSKISDLDGRIIGADGKTIRTLEKADVHDMSGLTSYSLYEDWRTRTAALYYDRYPYTVEFTYEKKYNGLIDWPMWEAQWIQDPVEHSAFEITLHDTAALRYWTNADSVKPATTSDGDSKTYAWEARDLPEMTEALKDEDDLYRTMVVVTAPREFEIGDSRGEMSSWHSFGAWNRSLYDGRDVLPTTVREEVRTIASRDKGPRHVALDLYRYLQTHTRYVSVQLGIGGWQPFDAAYVAQRGYGDCKALSNYMVALLKQAGITGYPVLVHSGSLRGVYLRDFPRQEFNHVIVCVPFEKDSLWFECTSQSMPGGHIGNATEQRFGLLLGPNGGELVNTPTSPADSNVQRRQVRAMLDFTGSVNVRSNTAYTGDQQDGLRNQLIDASTEERTHWMHDNLDVPNADILSYRLSGIDTPTAAVGVQADFTVPRYAQITGGRMFLQLNMMDRETYIPKPNPNRRSPIRHGYAYRDIDTIVYQLPGGYAVEGMPAPADVNVTFGEFHARCTSSGDSTLTYTRWLEIREPVSPASLYGEYREFLSAVVKADRAQAVLTRKER